MKKTEDNQMKKLYVGTLVTKKGGRRRYVINVQAENMGAAKDLIKDLWYKHHPDTHAFSVEARRLHDDEEYLYNWFAQRSYSDYHRCKG